MGMEDYFSTHRLIVPTALRGRIAHLFGRRTQICSENSLRIEFAKRPSHRGEELGEGLMRGTYDQPPAKPIRTIIENPRPMLERQASPCTIR